MVRGESLGQARRATWALPRPGKPGGVGQPCPTRSGLPFSTAALLGLSSPGVQVLVVDGTVVQYGRHRPAPGEGVVLANGTSRAIYRCATLEALLTEALRTYQAQIARWVGKRCGVGDRGLLLESQRQPSQLVRGIRRFVHGTLIPRLRKEATGVDGGAGDLGEAEEPKPLTLEMATQHLVARLQVSWPPAFSFSRYSFSRLVPFAGTPVEGLLHLEWAGKQYVGLEHHAQRVILADMDRQLEELVFATFQAPAWPQLGVLKCLYRDELQAVLQSPQGQTYCCRQIPSYVVEGFDRRFYRFAGVQIGIWITSLEVREVIGPLAARVMHQYSHMFVHSAKGGDPICMPRPEDYYPRLHDLPLEEALLQHLEAARMTLCSGYHQGNRSGWMHPLGTAGQQRLTEREARDCGLPIYRFYRH